MQSDIVWAFQLGHGHAAQFGSFRESCPPEVQERSRWAGMSFTESGDPIANSRWVPSGIKSRRHEMWHLRDAMRRAKRDDVLFLASWNLRTLPFMWRYRSYLYLDFSPSLMRSLHPWYDHFFRSAPRQAVRELFARGLPASAKGIFTMSQWAAEGIVRDYGVDPARVRTVLPGANLASWSYTDRADRERDVVRVLMVGGEFRRKGGELLLAWARNPELRNVELDIVTWPEQLPDWVRAAIGNPGSYGAGSGSLAPELPHVRVHCGLSPNSPQVKALYADADIFCLPTQADFSSIAALEAMSSGLPVIVGRVGGIPELIDEGKTGFCIAPGDTAQLDLRLRELAADRALRLRMGKAAREACELRFNVERQMNEIVEHIDSDA
jgi:glycosyltransferase involved in cell wall biosynthesis